MSTDKLLKLHLRSLKNTALKAPQILAVIGHIEVLIMAKYPHLFGKASYHLFKAKKNKSQQVLAAEMIEKLVGITTEKPLPIYQIKPSETACKIEFP